jgi:hypothetical protein
LRITPVSIKNKFYGENLHGSIYKYRQLQKILNVLMGLFYWFKECKKKSRMTSSPASLKRMASHQKNGRLGPG